MAYIQTLYNFLIEATLLDITTSESTDLSDFLYNVKVREQYVSDAFPLIALDLKVDESTKNQIQDDEIQIKLSVFRYIADSDSNQADEEDESIIATNDVVFETLLKIYVKPKFSTETETNTEDDILDDSDENDTQTVPLFACTLTGIPLTQLKINSKVVNQVYNNVKIPDVALNLLTEHTDMDIYMQYPDNLVSEDSVFIPAMNLVPALKFLQEGYGIYKYDMAVYFGLEEKCYIYAPLKPKTTNLNTLTIQIEKTSGSNSDKYTGVYLDEETNNLKLYLRNTPGFSTNETITQNDLGNTRVFNSFDENFELITRVENDGADADFSVKKRYFWNSSNKAFFEEKFINNTKASDEFTSVVLMNTDPILINPATKVSVISSSDSAAFMTGEYAILTKQYQFSSSDQTHFNSSIILSLAKID